ncbi:o-succinylbenzoate synthase [Peribacillus frigoritolerans]|uniref:o-succinylbenzoate synthase n=1 Tax=Peribacillus frigoritolerans TaxID=450367 RepID=UPI0025A20A6D|nr:o-succinylbenzoate synthase [Peribacillus frigoritolerans]MDM5304928.1 o-succinylbenzoate synthase [Peribacillus frigoritolerans]
MKITEVRLRHLNMDLVASFTTSFGTFVDKEFILVEVKNGKGLSGWAESVAFSAPWYNEETIKTNWTMLEDFLIPLVLDKEIEHPRDVSDMFSHIRKNNMAKSAIEGAIWDLYAKEKNIPLSMALGGELEKIEVGISIGIQKTVPELLAKIETGLKDGYKRVKMKIQPGWDVDVIREVRNRYPDIPIMADANSAYRLKDIELLKQLDQFDLMMIEQPLSSDDIVDHATLQAEIKTPICLDESIHSVEDARKALELGSCKIINIKIGRVGGLTEAMKIHELCKERNVPVWCGGMLESGVGRAHNIALTTLDNFTMPGDTAASANYWHKDIIQPEVTVNDGVITVPKAAGIGYEVDYTAVDEFTSFSKRYTNK